VEKHISAFWSAGAGSSADRWLIRLGGLSFCVAMLFLLSAPPGASGREKDAIQYGMGLIVNIPFPEGEVAQIVQEIVQNGIIRGTKEYNKDEYVTGAEATASTPVFPSWTEGGKVFYKIRLKALDPRNFKDGTDVGTLAVRYVVQPQDDKHTVLRIDARFVEDFRHISHPSNGSVESAEYKDIHEHLDAMEVIKTQTADAEQSSRQSPMLRDESPSTNTPAQPGTAEQAIAGAGAPSATKTESNPASLEQQVHELRQQVQWLVKAPGAPLKSAPFHTATTLQALSSGTEVLIVISTPYWFGVETHEGQHGWILRDELEPIP
jgi:hypothetical protein